MTAEEDADDQPDLPFASPLPRSERPFLEEAENPFAFDHVSLRFRHDGWTPERQERFIEALATTGCVEQAARAVGKSVSSAYALKTRAEAQPFRLAWEAALEVGVKRLSEAALSRAIHGVAQPVFYKGEQVGERRHYDERLTMFLLRYRDPARFGPWIDRVDSVEEKFDGASMLLRQMLNRMIDKLFGEIGEDAFDRAVKRGELPDPEEMEPEEDEDEDWDEEGMEEEGEGEIDRRPGEGRGRCEEMASDSPNGPGLRRGDADGVGEASLCSGLDPEPKGDLNAAPPWAPALGQAQDGPSAGAQFGADGGRNEHDPNHRPPVPRVRTF